MENNTNYFRHANQAIRKSQKRKKRTNTQGLYMAIASNSNLSIYVLKNDCTNAQI